jgi:hypothetical protein
MEARVERRMRMTYSAPLRVMPCVAAMKTTTMGK